MKHHTFFLPLCLGAMLGMTALLLQSHTTGVESLNTDGSIVLNTHVLPSFKMKKFETEVSFLMGLNANAEGVQGNETPAHTVRLKPFAISKTEVTQELWEYVMHSNPSLHKDPQLPVENVSWNDVQSFLEALNAQSEVKAEGLTFRLPTEAEWECAARAIGSDAPFTAFSGSNNVEEVAWYKANSSQEIEDVSEQCTHEVGKKKPNALDIYDLSGNVAEWVQDELTSYTSHAVSNPCATTGSNVHVVRGGHYLSQPDELRVTYRFAHPASYRSGQVGFRLAVDYTSK